jgi:hypothetical protein
VIEGFFMGLVGLIVMPLASRLAGTLRNVHGKSGIARIRVFRDAGQAAPPLASIPST